jgi:protein ImuB
LFPDPNNNQADFNRLIELLTARLGPESVLIPAPVADHRPECCNRWRHAAETVKPGFYLPEDLVRPFMLLDKPISLLLRDHRPFYGSSLRLVRGPERIESGWDDGALAARDYFVAEGSEGVCYWIYRERADQQALWYLHGFFA